MPSATFTLQTSAPIELLEITEQIRSACKKSGFKNGLCHVASGHTTSAIVINEKCAELEKDIVQFLKDFAPAQKEYFHNKVASDGRPNAHSHLLSLTLPSSVTIAIENGELQLGTWQRVFFVELDGPREKRTVRCSFVGEK